SGGRDNRAYAWELETGKELRAFDFADPVMAAYIFPDGRWALASDAATLKLIDLKTGDAPRSLRLGSLATLDMTVSPDGSRIVACCSNELRMWNTETGADV